MRVLYYTQGYGPHDERFLTALANTSHEVLLLRALPDSNISLPAGIVEVGLQGGLSTIPMGIRRQLQRFRRVITTHQPDLVHAGPMHGPAFIAALAGFSPLVSMSWGYDMQLDVKKLTSKIAIRHTLRKSTIFTGDCRVVAEKAQEFGFPRERIHIFPWGVDLAHFSPGATDVIRQQLGWQEHFVFLSNRSLEPKYGVDVLLDAFINAAQTNPNLRLLLYGKGSMENELRQQVLSAGMQSRVHFGGFASRDELPGVYCSADVFITASHCDGSSVSLMEALACGCPVIVSDIPANLEWVQEGKQGWIFRDGDSTALAQKILDAAAYGELDRLSANTRKLAETKADWSRNFPVLLEAYLHALEIHSATSSTGEK